MELRFRLTRARVVLFAALAALITASGIAYAAIPAADGTYYACKLNSTGTIRLIDKSLSSTSWLSKCNASLETEVSWNKGAKGDPGTNGEDGVSVTSEALSAGDPNCASGGSKFTAANGVTYACNGINGTNGTNGTNGQDGVSVTSEAEPAGANCAHGGSKFTAANGTTYACDGPGITTTTTNVGSPVTVAAGACAAASLNVPGAGIGDVVVPTIPTSLHSNLILAGSLGVTAPDTVTLRFCNTDLAQAHEITTVPIFTVSVFQ